MPDETPEKVRKQRRVKEIVVHERNTLGTRDRHVDPTDIFITGYGWVSRLYIITDEEPEVIEL